jgi:hypothetical protein
MSAIHYSQMLCQLSYGEAIASCLLALETSTGLRIKYELTNDVITPPSTHPIDPVLPHPFTARTPGPTSARRPARKARRAVAQAPRQSPPIAAPAAARVRGRRAQIRRCPAPHCCRPPAVAVAVGQPWALQSATFLTETHANRICKSWPRGGAHRKKQARATQFWRQNFARLRACPTGFPKSS